MLWGVRAGSRTNQRDWSRGRDHHNGVLLCIYVGVFNLGKASTPTFRALGGGHARCWGRGASWRDNKRNRSGHEGHGGTLLLQATIEKLPACTVVAIGFEREPGRPEICVRTGGRPWPANQMLRIMDDDDVLLWVLSLYWVIGSWVCIASRVDAEKACPRDLYNPI